MPQLPAYQNFIAVTDRSLCRREFLDQIRLVASLHPCALLLREKDLPAEEYRDLAVRVQEICRAQDVPFIVHGRVDIARSIGCPCLHLPLPALRALGQRPAGFELVSTSCHSKEDMREAVSLGADRILLGTIFPTPCKEGLPGKGLPFLREVCACSPVPVFAIGGIRESHLDDILAAGAAGACMMSGFMCKSFFPPEKH